MTCDPEAARAWGSRRARRAQALVLGEHDRLGGELVFLSPHARVDELEWRRENQKLDGDQRERAVTDLIELVAAVAGILQLQAQADADSFLAASQRVLDRDQQRAITDALLKAYRWQYIVSGMQDGRFWGVLSDLITPAQAEWITTALAPLMG